MDFRSAGIPGATAESSVLPVAILFTTLLAGMAVIAGLATAVVGGMAGYRAVYYVAIFALFVIGSLVTLTRKEPLRFAFLALIACFPIATAEIPPGRFELTVFNAVMVVLAIGLIGKQFAASSAAAGSLFPTRALLLACLLVIPCILFSQYPLWSLREFVFKNLMIYVFLLFALDELQREKGFERLVFLLSIVLLFLAAALYVEYFLHVNLSVRGSNLNQSTISESGMTIRRAGGFFQDPQRAGAYLACMITFLLVLASRGRFSGMKMQFLVWAAIAASLGAIATTISRSAILACLSVSALTFFLFNKWNAAVKLLILGSMAVVVTSLAMIPLETWLNLLPAMVLDRFLSMQDEVGHRLLIWLDTWDMFADHPVAGIGIASFRPYLIETRPAIFNYYDIGTAAGVAYIPDQPESGYLKILYEGGILGSLAALVVVGDAIRRAIAVIADNTTQAQARTELIASLAAIATFGMTFATLYTAADERIAALFSVFLAVILHHSLQAGRPARKAAQRP